MKFKIHIHKTNVLYFLPTIDIYVNKMFVPSYYLILHNINVPYLIPVRMTNTGVVSEAVTPARCKTSAKSPTSVPTSSWSMWTTTDAPSAPKRPSDTCHTNFTAKDLGKTNRRNGSRKLCRKGYVTVDIMNL